MHDAKIRFWKGSGKVRYLFSNSGPVITHGLGRALMEMGENVRMINLSAAPDPRNCLEESLQEFQPDYVLTEGGWGNLYSMLFPILTEKQVPHVFWAIEDPPYFDSISLPFAKKSALTFTTAAECLPLYHRMRIEAFLLMFACLPSFHRKVEQTAKFQSDCIFIGNNYAQFSARQRGIKTILQPLIERKYDVKVYGYDWWVDSTYPFHIPPSVYGGYVSYDETPSVYANAKIVLGINSVDTSRTMMSMRAFEVMGCGAFFLTQWTPAVESYFKNGVHLVWSKSPEETIRLVDYYLEHPEKREEIARNGQMEVYSRHTYQHRVKDMQQALQVITTKTGRGYRSKGGNASFYMAPLNIEDCRLYVPPSTNKK